MTSYYAKSCYLPQAVFCVVSRFSSFCWQRPHRYLGVRRQLRDPDFSLRRVHNPSDFCSGLLWSLLAEALGQYQTWKSREAPAWGSPTICDWTGKVWNHSSSFSTLFSFSNSLGYQPRHDRCRLFNICLILNCCAYDDDDTYCCHPFGLWCWNVWNWVVWGLRWCWVASYSLHHNALTNYFRVYCPCV